MTVKEFIEFLETQPQDIQVAYRCCSEQCLLNTADISIVSLKYPRDDGWIHEDWHSEKDEPKQNYLMLPGN